VAAKRSLLKQANKELRVACCAFKKPNPQLTTLNSQPKLVATYLK